MSAPACFTTHRLKARRLVEADLAFVQSLMEDPRMNAHKPDPAPPGAAAIARNHARDLDHWQSHGFGRYLVHKAGAPVGLCGLTLRAGMEGLNLSYHIAPAHWGCGLATELVRGLVDLARRHLPDKGPVYGLVRPANPASAAVLQKAGFARDAELMLGGAPTVRYVRAI